jgi:hypothetical protein
MHPAKMFQGDGSQVLPHILPVKVRLAMKAKGYIAPRTYDLHSD